LNKFIGLGLNCILIITKPDALKVSQSETGWNIFDFDIFR